MPIYDSSGNLLYDASTSVKASIAYNLRDTAYLKQMLSESGGSMQGACTDGTYIYYVYHDRNVLKKYNIQTGEVTSVTYTEGQYGHANDMTYNPNTGYIYIDVMDTDCHIAIVDPSTLEQVEQFVLYDGDGEPLATHGIAYDRINNRYVFANATVIPGTYGQRYTVTDASFNYVKTIVMPQPETHTIQGIETDGYFIYRALSATGTNYVSVYDYDGNFIKTINIPDSTELETVIHDWQGNWYCNFNRSGGGKLFICGLHKFPFENIEKIIALS